MSTFGLGIKRFPQDFFNKNRRQPESVVFDAETMTISRKHRRQIERQVRRQQGGKKGVGHE